MSHAARFSVSRVSRRLEEHGARLDAGRLRVQAVALAAGLWITAGWTLLTPGLFDRNGLLKGIDFLQFYAAAQIVAEGDSARLYDWELFAQRLKSAVPGTGDLLFLSVYPPQLALAMTPLGRLPYGWALAAWSVTTVFLYALCIGLIARQFPHAFRGVPWWLLALAFVPFQQLLAHGQIGMLVLVCLTAAWAALRRGRCAWFGFFLGSLLFKPSFLVAPALAAIAAPRLAVIGGIALGAGVQVALVSLALGPEVWIAYGEKARVLIANPEMFEPKPWQMHSIKAFWQLLLGTNILSLVLWLSSSLLTIGALVYIWRRARSSDLQMGALVVAAVLLNPHLYVYDLVALGVAFASLIRSAFDTPDAPASRRVAALVHLLWWAPLVGPLAALTRVQLTPILLAALLAALVPAVRTRADAEERSTAGLRSA